MTKYKQEGLALEAKGCLHHVGYLKLSNALLSIIWHSRVSHPTKFQVLQLSTTYRVG
jgi:hypothetical protein